VTAAPERLPLTRTARFAWGAVAVILVGVVVLLVDALTGTPVTFEVVHRIPVSPGVLHALADVPPASFDTVGTDAPGTGLTPPRVQSGQPLLTTGGKPEVFFVGSEFCPFCAAERWPLVVALSRFGRFETLDQTQSSSSSVVPSIQTFSFVGAHYASPYVTFTGVELYSNVPAARGGFTRIATLTPTQQSLVNRYQTNLGASGGAVVRTYPFVDIGNAVTTSTSGFSPAVLVQQSQAALLAGLRHPNGQPASTALAARATLAAANELTAGICEVTAQRPGSVCGSPGVEAADQTLGIS